MGYGLVAPLALYLDTEVSARFGERDLDLPSADVQRDDVGGFEGEVMSSIIPRRSGLTAAVASVMGWSPGCGKRW